jgi:hypothetical protein
MIESREFSAIFYIFFKENLQLIDTLRSINAKFKRFKIKIEKINQTNLKSC